MSRECDAEALCEISPIYYLIEERACLALKGADCIHCETFPVFFSKGPAPENLSPDSNMGIIIVRI